MSTLSGAEIADADLTDWSQLRKALHTRLLTGSFATGLALVNKIGEAAESANHHPDIDLRYAYVDIRLTSHDVGGLSQRDVDLARTISTLAAEAGVRAEPLGRKMLEVALDTPDADAVRPFWQAVLAMEELVPEGSDPELNDDTLPGIWFQPSGSGEPRQRWHFDLWVPPQVVEGRIAAAVAAGGSMVDDSSAPSYWVLADPEGNRVCLCTPLERDLPPS